MDGSPPLVLASGSPRRAAVMDQLGLPYEVRVSNADETRLARETAEAFVQRVAAAKSREVARPGELVFGFDTVVVHGGEVLGKPASPEEAAATLLRLSDGAHQVYTGVALVFDEQVQTGFEVTDVEFRSVTPGEAAAYVASGEPLDKAGSYGIQGLGAALVTRVDGDFFNVMGFPIGLFQDLLAQVGWRYEFGQLTPITDGRPRRGPAGP